MPGQPNPPDNPYERGFLLPPGCKDLIDAIAGPGKAKSLESCRFAEGGFVLVRWYLSLLYQEKTIELVLMIANYERNAILLVSGTKAKFELTSMYRRGNMFVENAISEVFGEQAQLYKREQADVVTVGLPLPGYWDQAAQCIIDLLNFGWGLQDQSRLLFLLQEIGQIPEK